MGFGRVKNLINGEWVDSNSKEILEVRNPALGEVIAEAPMSTTQNEVHQAIQAAKETFNECRSTPPPASVRCLFRLKELLEENFEELYIVQTKEHGKTIDESRGTSL